MIDIKYLDEDEVLALYSTFIGQPTLRNPGGFSSAVNRSQQSAFGEDAYPTLFLKAAALMQSLAENQSFIDGNKRIAWLAGNAFLNLNSRAVYATANEINALFRERIASGMSVPDLADWLQSHSTEVPK